MRKGLLWQRRSGNTVRNNESVVAMKVGWIKVRISLAPGPLHDGFQRGVQIGEGEQLQAERPVRSFENKPAVGEGRRQA
jgi:hypothetical protein